MQAADRAIDVNGPSTIVAGILLGTVGVLSFIVQPGLVQGYATTFGIGEDAANFLASAEGFGITGGTFAAAFASRTVNWRWIVPAALLLAGFGNMVSAGLKAPDAAFGAVRFVTGLGEGGIIAMSFSVIGLTRRIERNLALYLIVLLTYGAFGLTAMPTALASIGLSGIFLAWGVVSLAAILTVRAIPRGAHDRAEPSPTAADVGLPMLAVGLLAVLAYNTAIGMAWTNLFFIGLEVRNDVQAIANALLLSQFVAIAGALIPVFMESRFGRWFPLISGILLAVGAIAMLLGQPTYAMFIFAVCLFNFIWNFFLPFLLSAVGDLSTREIMPVTIAMQMFGLVGLGPFVAGSILGASGSQQAALAVTIALLLTSLALLALAEIARGRAHATILSG